MHVASVLALGAMLLPGASADDPPQRTLVRGEVVDADSGRPLACRVYVQGEDGTWYFPESEASVGSAVRYRKSVARNPSSVEMHTTLSAHPFVVRLPAGRYRLTVERGKEYHPQAHEVVVSRDPVRVSFRLSRWIDMAARGWYSGDTHVHRPPAELPNLMRAEDLNVAFPLTDWVQDAFVPPVERRKRGFGDLGPKPITVDTARVVFARNTEYEIFRVDSKVHTLGAFFVLRHQTPLDVGVPPVGPVARRAHAEGALIELDKHNWPWSMMLVPVMPVDLYELSNNHLWRTDFAFHDYGEPAPGFMQVERDAQGWTEQGWVDFGLRNYYTLLDCGFRLRPTAGTASGVHPVPFGFGRVYVHLPDGFDADAWVRGLDAGRSFVTTGPMLFVTLNGQDPGHRFERNRPGREEYDLSGLAVSAVPLGRIEVIVNGDVAHTLTPANRKTEQGGYESPIDARLPIDGSSWVAVRCFEDRPDRRVRFAHSAPFHIDVAERPLRPRRAEVDFLIRRVEEQLERNTGVLSEPALEEYREALRAYRKVAELAR